MKLGQLVSGITIALISCVEPYEPKINDEVFDILVVDGYINTTDRSAKVRLSRAVPVDQVMPPSSEDNATVLVEDEGGTTYALYNSGQGLYVADELGLALSPPPVALPEVTISLLWHASYDGDPGNAWLRETVGQAASEPLAK